MQDPIHIDFVGVEVMRLKSENLETPHVVSYIVKLSRCPPPRHVDLFTMANDVKILPETHGQTLSNLKF